MLVVNISGLGTIPKWFFEFYLSILALIFFWWPIDLLVHWEKRTDNARRKDTIILIVVSTFILFIYPYYFLVTPFWPTAAIAFIVGGILPSAAIFYKKMKARASCADPAVYQRLALTNERVKEFMKYFPDHRQYVTGLSAADGDRLHFLMHHREPYQDIRGAQIDYVLDIGIDRRLGIIIGKEQLQCYIFFNSKEGAKIGFLPSSNIGRALDYGFSEEEIQEALKNAHSEEQHWPALKDDPLIIQHYPGRTARLR
ncbi:MAG: hypothetical protein AB1656_08540 [Candidatus Omnitrophota bacterium]